ncbi:hypothetical protein NFI96_029855, partial [Prochilodus magdalenae]
PRRSHGHHRKRNTSNLIYAPRSSPTQTRVVGGLWNCQSAVQKADFISALASHHSLHFLALTETWITHENSSTPAALSSAFNFSHSPRQTGRGGGTGNFIDELDTLLSLFPVDGSPLLLLGHFNLPSDKLQSTGSSPPAPWLSDVLRNKRRELERAERKWRRSQIDSELHTYQAILSRFSGEVTSAKSSFYKRKLEESASDPRKLFSICSSLLNPPSPPPPSSLTPEDFVTFFEEKQLSSLSTDDVLQLLESSNPTTCPLDPIPSTLLQLSSLDLLPFISFLINCSLLSGHVPQAFRTARVVPILKKHPRWTPQTSHISYRPVSLLSFLSKILLNVLSIINSPSFSPRTSFTSPSFTSTSPASNQPIPRKLLSSHLFDTVNHKILLSVLTDLGTHLEALHGSGLSPTWRIATISNWFSQRLSLITAMLMIRNSCFPSHHLIHRWSATASQHASTDISSWMSSHHLKLNPSKTELLFIPSTTGPHRDLAISFGNSSNLTRSCRFLLYNSRGCFDPSSLKETPPAACPVSGHFKARLLQLAPGLVFLCGPSGPLTVRTLQPVSSKSSKVHPSHSTAALPSLAF